MKKISILFIAVSVMCISLLKPSAAIAQKEQGQSVVTVGAGASIVGLLYSTVKNSVNSSGGQLALHSTPAILGMYDFGVSDRFSVGAAISYQTFSLEYTDYVYGTNTVPYTFKDRTTRMNFAIRPLFHVGNSDDLDMYLGARIGYTNWAYTTSNTDPNYNLDNSYSGSFGNPIKVQVVLFGIRYFFNENIGINGELTIGAPYYMMGGINFKF